MKSMSQKTELIKQLEREVTNLKNSPLAEFRKENGWLPVIGEGSLNSKVMLIGEAPGKNEAEQGRPFCGASGRILDGLLESAGLQRKNTYITAVVKDRPPGNRDPKPGEIELYAPFLDRQIEIIKPRIIIMLGRFAGEYIMDKFSLGEKFTSISEVHGKVFPASAKYGKIRVIPMYHPAVALYNGAGKKALEEDYKSIKGVLSRASSKTK